MADQRLTLDDVIEAAHAKGYVFDEVAAAMHEIRDDDGYWTKRGPAALLAAVRSANTSATQADLPGCGSRTVRV